MKRISTLLLIAAACGLSATCVNAEPAHYEEWTSAGGKINWSTGHVAAEGYGVSPAITNTKAGPLLACRAAIVDAQRNLLEATQGVRVTATSVIDNYMLKSDEVKSSVEGIIRNARILSRQPDNTGGCKVTLAIGLAGNPMKSIHKELNSQKTSFVPPDLQRFFAMFISQAHAQEVAPEELAPWSQAVTDLNSRLTQIENSLSDIKKTEATNLNPKETDLLPTGLIVDARGSNFIPSLSPKIRQLRGGVVYPNAKEASSSKFLERGQLVSLFTTDVDFAISHPTVGNRPLLVKALRTYGDTRTEIVLSTEQAGKVEGLSSEGFFDQAGVIIVLD